MAYAIVGWLLIEVSTTVLPLFEAPDWIAQVFAFFVILGFPLALILSWAYEMTPEGVKKTADVPEGEGTFATARTGQTLNYMIIAILVVAVGYLVWERQIPAPPGVDTSVQTDDTVKAIAVLPFVNLSDDPEQEFFSDGISEELLNVLARVQGLRVTSRTSAFSFKGTNTPIPEVAAELGVQYVLEGSVRRGNEEVRITAQLIDVETDSNLWSESYNRRIDNIFAVQDEIAGQVATALEVALLGVDAVPLRPVRETFPEAYSDYLLARQLLGDPSSAKLLRSAELLEGVIARDPNYAPAFGALAWTYWRMTQHGSMSIQDSYERMRVIVPRALELDDILAEAWIMQSILEWMEGRRPVADIARERALELGPENPIVLYEAIYSSLWLRDPEPASSLAEQLVRVDPLGPESLRRASDFYARVGDLARARELLDRIRTINPESLRYLWSMFTQGHFNDDVIEARILMEEIYRIDPLDPEAPGFIAQINVDMGDIESATRWSAEALEVDPNHPFSLLQAMYLALVQDDTDEAVRIAERLVGEDMPGRIGSKALALGVLANRDDLAGRPEDTVARYLRTYPSLVRNQIPIYDPRDSWPVISVSLYAALDLARVYRRAGETANAEALLAAVEQELPYWPGAAGMWGIGFAEVELYALRGEKDEALQALRAAVDDDLSQSWRWRLLHNPNLESLQGDSEFQAIVDQMEARMGRELDSLGTTAAGA